MNTQEWQDAVTFTLQRWSCSPGFLNNLLFTECNLRLFIEKNHSREIHTKNLKDKKCMTNFFIDFTEDFFKLSMKLKRLMYNTNYQTYVDLLERWVAVKSTNIRTIYTWQSKLLLQIVDAAFYVTKLILRNYWVVFLLKFFTSYPELFNDWIFVFILILNFQIKKRKKFSKI